MSNYIEERTYYPDGANPDDYNDTSWKVGVYYRGKGKWMVAADREGYNQLSSTGKWLTYPLKMVAMKHCRFTFEEACERAEAAVDTRTVAGRTWQEYNEWRNAKRESA